MEKFFSHNILQWPKDLISEWASYISTWWNGLGDGLVQADQQVCGVLFTHRQLKEEWRLIDVADLLVDVDIQHGGLVAGAVPAEEVHVGEDLLELLLLHLVVLEVDHHGLTGGQLVV